MIASLRGLVVLAVIVAGLVLALLVASPTSAVVDRTLVPGFSSSTVMSLELSYTGKHKVSLIRTSDTWKIHVGLERVVDSTNSYQFQADTSTVDAVLAALRGATWHRRADATIAYPTRGELRVSLHDANHQIQIGREITGGAQTWLILGDHALLVDSWVAHALLPDPLELRVRQPLAGAAAAYRVSGSGVVLEGRFQTEPAKRWIPEPAMAEIVGALVDLTIVSLDGMHPAAKGRAVSIFPTRPEERLEMFEAGTCDGDRIRVETTGHGTGCIERAAWQRAITAFEPFVRPDDPSLVDTRIAPFTPGKVSFLSDTDETVLDLAGRPRLGTDDNVDLDRVQELLAALATPGVIVPRPNMAARRYIDIDSVDRGRVRLGIHDGGVIDRAEEPFALRPPREAFAVITRPTSALLDPILWREDKTTLSSISLDGVTYQRGVVLGEWDRTPAGKVDAPLVWALLDVLGHVRGPAGPPPSKVAHTLAVTFTPPVGKPVTHTLELALPTSDGCAALVDKKPARLNLPLCTAVVALAASR